MAVLKSSISCFQQLLKIQPERSPFQKIFPNNCIVLCHTLDHLSSHCKALLQKQGKCQLDFFCILHCQCHNVRLSIFTMSKCHNVAIFTIFPISQCHTIHNISMSQGQNTSQCLNVTMSHFSQYLDVTMAINSPGPPLCHDEASC